MGVPARIGSMRQFRIKSKEDLLRDLMTGVILALLSIPLSVGYAWVAGLPPQYGLYGALFPTLVFCLISSSPRFVFGVDAAPAALVGNLLPALGIIGGSAEAVSMMPIITLLTALWLLLFWLLRGGRFAKYISEPVLGGCVTGIASIVLLTQLPSLFGGTMATGRAPTLIAHLIRELGDFHWPSFLLGAGTVAVILVGRRRSKISFSVIMMVLGILTSLIFHWEKYGVTMVGAIPPGLPVPVRFDLVASWCTTLLNVDSPPVRSIVVLPPLPEKVSWTSLVLRPASISTGLKATAVCCLPRSCW